MQTLATAILIVMSDEKPFDDIDQFDEYLKHAFSVFCAKNSVTSVTQAGHDVSLVVEVGV